MKPFGKIAWSFVILFVSAAPAAACTSATAIPSPSMTSGPGSDSY